ncbi:hypothetical protein [Nocardia brasiliensis]|nr:hypothetical protein [Nocardia brasiliensis]
MNLSPKAIRAAVALGAVALVLIVAAVLATPPGDQPAPGFANWPCR